MKYLFGFFLLLVFLIPRIHAQFVAPPFFVNKNYKLVQSINQAAASATFPSPNTKGNLLVAVVTTYSYINDSNIITVSDTAGNTWIATPPGNFVGNGSVQIFYAPNAAYNASNTVTASAGTITVLEYSGFPTNTVMDSYSVNSGDSTSASSGNLTTTRDDLVIAGYDFNGTTGAQTPSTGFNSVYSDSYTNILDNASAGTLAGKTVNPTVTFGTFAPWGGTAIALRGTRSAMPVAPTKIAITSAAVNANTWTCSPLTVQAQDAGGTQRVLQQDFKVALSGTGMYFFSDSRCGEQINNILLWAGESQKTVYFTMGTAGTYTLTGTPTNSFAAVTQSETATLAPFTWIGGTSTDWATASNWSGNAVPGAGDSPIFDGNCTTNCNSLLPASAVTISNLNLTNAYTGTLTAGAAGASLTISNLLSIRGGTFAGSTTSAVTTGNVYLGYNGTWTLSTSTITVNGSYVIISGTFSGSIPFNLTGSSMYIDGEDGNTGYFPRLTFNKAGGTFTIGRVQIGTIGTSSITAGTVVDKDANTTLTTNGGTFSVTGTLSMTKGSYSTINGAFSTAAAGTVNIDGGSTILWIPSSKGTSFANAGTFTCTGALSKFQIWYGGINNTGTFNGSKCSTYISTTDGTARVINGNNSFYSLFIGSNLTTVTLQAGKTQTIGAGGFSAYNVKLRSSSAGTAWNISTVADETVGTGVDVKDSNNTGGFVLHSGTGYTDSGNNTNWTFP